MAVPLTWTHVDDSSNMSIKETHRIDFASDLITEPLILAFHSNDRMEDWSWTTHYLRFTNNNAYFSVATNDLMAESTELKPATGT